MTISMEVTISREDVIENVKDGENLRTTTKAGENSKNLRKNLTQVQYI